MDKDMKAQNETIEINILGIKYKVSSAEGEGNAYVKQAAAYVSGMYQKLQEIPGFTRRSKDYQNLMMYLNMADDYLRASEWTEDRQLAANQDAEQEINALKEQLQETVAHSMETEQRLQEEMAHLKKKVEYSFHERNHYMEQKKNAEYKTMSLEKELAGYKTETSVMKRKMDELMRNAEAVEKMRKETSMKTKDWEERMLRLKGEMDDKFATDRDSLVQSYEDKLKELRDGNTYAIEDMKKDYEAQLAQQKADYEAKLAEQMPAHEAEIAQLKADYEGQLFGMKEGYEARLLSMKSDNDRRIGQMKIEQENLAHRMKTAHDAKLERVTNELKQDQAVYTEPLKKQIAQLESENSAQKEALIDCQDRLQEAEKEIASLRYKLQEAEIEHQ